MESIQISCRDVTEGMVLAQGVTVDGRRLAKGRVLDAEDVMLLRRDERTLPVIILEPEDVHEDAAALRMAEVLAGGGVEVSRPSTGRINLCARAHGLLWLDETRLRDLNRVDESLTVATAVLGSRVAPRQLVATVKVIPFAVSTSILDAWLERAGTGPRPIAVDPFRPRRVALIQTRLPGVRSEAMGRVESKTIEGVSRRLASLGSTLVESSTVEHRVDALAPALEAVADLDLVVVAGAVAPAGRHDVVPRALELAGGRVEQLGMPVDPGNLLLLGRLGETPVIGMPGCARSPKLNGFDWVLQRLCAGWTVGPQELRDMGIGGLLKEIASRPAPRSQAVPWPEATTVEALILAAGRSSRMRDGHKLLRTWRGRPLVAAVVDRLQAGGFERPYLVSGHRHREVEEAVAGRVRAVHNPDFAFGMSTSLRRGVAALPEACAGVLVCLGDMPSILPVTIRVLVDAFRRTDGRALCVPVMAGRRGHPVLIGRAFFAEIHDIEGDRGAKALLAGHPESVVEVEVEDPGIFADVDTEQDLARQDRDGRGTESTTN